MNRSARSSASLRLESDLAGLVFLPLRAGRVMLEPDEVAEVDARRRDQRGHRVVQAVAAGGEEIKVA